MKNIIFFGHHKCGSRYFRNSLLIPLAKANGIKVHHYMIKSPPFHYRVSHDLDLLNIDWSVLNKDYPKLINIANAGTPVVRAIEATGAPFLGVRVVRDPRQVWVSDYFHHLEGHNVSHTSGWVWDQLLEDRPRLEALNQEDGLLYELDHITRDVLENQLFSWRPREGVMECKLEEVTPALVAEMIGFLGFADVPPLALEETFSNPQAQPWQDVLTPALKAEFKRRYGDDLIRMGYEKDHHW